LALAKTGAETLALAKKAFGCSRNPTTELKFRYYFGIIFNNNNNNIDITINKTK